MVLFTTVAAGMGTVVTEMTFVFAAVVASVVIMLVTVLGLLWAYIIAMTLNATLGTAHLGAVEITVVICFTQPATKGHGGGRRLHASRFTAPSLLHFLGGGGPDWLSGAGRFRVLLGHFMLLWSSLPQWRQGWGQS